MRHVPAQNLQRHRVLDDVDRKAANVFGQGNDHLRRSAAFDPHRPAMGVCGGEEHLDLTVGFAHEARPHAGELAYRLAGALDEHSDELGIVDVVARSERVFEMAVDAVLGHVGDVHHRCEPAARDGGAAALTELAFERERGAHVTTQARRSRHACPRDHRR